MPDVWYMPPRSSYEDVFLPGDTKAYEEYLDDLYWVIYKDFDTVSRLNLTSGHEV